MEMTRWAEEDGDTAKEIYWTSTMIGIIMIMIFIGIMLLSWKVTWL